MILLLAALSLQEPETVAVPGTSHEIRLLRVSGGGERGLKPFWMARTEAPADAFTLYFERREETERDGVTRPSAPYEPPNGEMAVADHPAVGMRLHGAQGFCLWLSEKTGQKFRLPTEAEWEAAATGTAAETAWCAENSEGKTHPLGAKEPNALGFHDLLGNVWEYVLEPYAPGQYNPVIRGGAWNTPAAELNVATRRTIVPAWYERDPNRPRSLWWLTDARFVGFRVIRVGEAGDQKAQAAYRSKVGVKDLAMGGPERGFIPVSGRVVNGGDRTLWEVEVRVHYRRPNGQPLLEDERGRPTYALVYPVLVNAWHPGEHAAPLGPGESRGFSVLVPQPYDVTEDPDRAAATIAGIRLGE